MKKVLLTVLGVITIFLLIFILVEKKDINNYFKDLDQTQGFERQKGDIVSQLSNVADNMIDTALGYKNMGDYGSIRVNSDINILDRKNKLISDAKYLGVFKSQYELLQLGPSYHFVIVEYKGKKVIYKIDTSTVNLKLKS